MPYLLAVTNAGELDKLHVGGGQVVRLRKAVRKNGGSAQEVWRKAALKPAQGKQARTFDFRSACTHRWGRRELISEWRT